MHSSAFYTLYRLRFEVVVAEVVETGRQLSPGIDAFARVKQFAFSSQNSRVCETSRWVVLFTGLTII